jgi:RNA polymerase sigma factor (sigma-70 family)
MTKKMIFDAQTLTAEFEKKRAHLRAVAFRMLGSASEADDAVQDAWLKVSRAETSDVENLGGWLTTVVARVCLDMLRARKSRREEPSNAHESAPIAGESTSPETQTLLADSVGIAMLVVLETLTPAERLAFVLHDMFDLSFEDIANVIGCSPPAARQLASRGRRRIQGASADPDADADLARQREVVDAFLAASRSGNLAALLAVLDPEITFRADPAAVAAAAGNQAYGAPKLAANIRGPKDVADSFLGRANAAQAALINGSVGAVWAPGGKPRAVLAMTIANGKIVAIDVVSDPKQIRDLDIAILD